MADSQEREQQGTLYYIKQYWAVLMLLISITIGWTQLDGKVDACELKITEQGIVIENNKNNIDDIERKYIEDITYIKTVLNQLLLEQGSVK